ncbi:MAG: dUTP diphosphatase [Nanoarchaeota archaeon]
MIIKIKKLSENAIIPTREYGNAGYDLYTDQYYYILPGDRLLVKTGISMEIPPGYYGHISDRSGMAYKKGAHCLGKIIDETFRGEVGIVLLNTDKFNPIEIQIGDRPAQIIFKKYEEVEFEEVKDLEITTRGEGWGSSGV